MEQTTILGLRVLAGHYHQHGAVAKSPSAISFADDQHLPLPNRRVGMGRCVFRRGTSNNVNR
jgi:hypothetical protein